MSFKRRFFRRILETREARELLMTSLAVGEADSAKGLDRVAAHVRDPLLSKKIYRHFADESMHARMLARRLESLGFESNPLPRELDYEAWAQAYGMGTPKSRIDDPRPFDIDDLILFFCGSKAGEERACKEMKDLIDALRADQETAALLEEIYQDELRHVSYATEELGKLARDGYNQKVVHTLRKTRRAEAKAHRRVSLAFMRRLMAILGYRRLIPFFAAIAINFEFARRWFFPGRLDRPLLADAMPVLVNAAPAPTARPASAPASASVAAGGESR